MTTPTQNGLDAVRSALTAVAGLMVHDDLEDRDRDLVEVARDVLGRLQLNLLERAQESDALTPPGDEADAVEPALPPADHEARLEVARDRAGWDLGDRTWADKIVAAYLDPEASAAELGAEMTTPPRIGDHQIVLPMNRSDS